MKSNKYQLVFISLLLLVIVGCSNKSNNNSLEVDPTSFVGNVIIDDQTHQMTSGGYRFDGETSSEITDAASPNQIAEEIDAISIAPDTVINVKIDQNPEVTLYQWEGSERGNAMDISENMFHSPTEPGKYVYEAFAEWDNLNNTHGWTSGEMSYTFVIEVK